MKYIKITPRDSMCVLSKNIFNFNDTATQSLSQNNIQNQLKKYYMSKFTQSIDVF